MDARDGSGIWMDHSPAEYYRSEEQPLVGSSDLFASGTVQQGSLLYRRRRSAAAGPGCSGPAREAGTAPITETDVRPSNPREEGDAFFAGPSPFAARVSAGLPGART